MTKEMFFYPRPDIEVHVSSIAPFAILPERRGMEENAHFCVWEDTAETLPPVTFIPISSLDRSSYNYFRAYHIAMSQAAITSRKFPGATAYGVAYPFEYATKVDTDFFDFKIAKLITDLSADHEIHLLEIGGQTGRWMSRLANQMGRFSERDFYGDIIDLNLYCRWEEAYPLWLKLHPKTMPRYIQGDAHQLASLAKEFALPKYDAVIFANVYNILYDPFSIFQQAWEQIREGGLLILYDSILQREMPFHLSLQTAITVETLGELMLFPANAEQYQQRLAKWRKDNINCIERIPGSRPFTYFSMADAEDANLAEVTRAVYQLQSPPRFNLHRTLGVLGYDVKTYTAGVFGYAMVIKKNMKNGNPFRHFQIDGLSRQPYHVDEYPFPQVERCIDIQLPSQ